MILSLGLFVILWSVLAVALLLLVATELKWAEQRNGETLRTLRAVFLAMALVIAFPLVGAVDSYTDFSPGFALRPVLENWVWIAYATLAGCVLRFWLALHRWARGKGE